MSMIQKTIMTVDLVYLKDYKNRKNRKCKIIRTVRNHNKFGHSGYLWSGRLEIRLYMVVVPTGNAHLMPEKVLSTIDINQSLSSNNVLLESDLLGNQY